MADPVTILETAGAAISLSEKVVEIVRAARKGNKEPKFEEVIRAVLFSASSAAGELESSLRDLKDELSEAGIDLDESVEGNYKSLKWHNLLSKHRLNKFEESLYALKKKLAAFIDDLFSLLICSNRTTSIRDGLMESRQLQRKIQELTISEEPLGELIDELLGIAEGVRDRLRGEEKREEVAEPVGAR